MDAGTHTINKIFGQDRRYVVPLFQRPYVWNREDQWEPLWDDVRTVAERLINGKPTRPHFMGAIVLDQQRQPTGRVETRLVIDGQQRLTTIQILLEAFADLAAEMGREKLHKALLKLTRNDDPMSEDPDEVFKVWPTNRDREAFAAVMKEGSPDGVRKTLEKQKGPERRRAIAEAYLFFNEAIREWIVAGSEDEKFEKLYLVLKDNLRMVVIDLDGQDEAQLIFETLNARGTRLLPSDLVKNHLFHLAERQGENLEKLYERWWQPFDYAEYWRDEVGKGRGKRARIDVFLQDFLTLHEHDDVKIAHLYDAYQEHIEKRGGEGPAQHMERLRRYADLYQSFDELPEGTPEAVFFTRLRALDMTTAHPFLLGLFARHGSNQDGIRQILRDIECFVVRRMVCRWTTKQYNLMFVELLKTLDAPSASVADAFREHLLSFDGESRRWPKDTEFREAWLNAPLGSALPRVRTEMLIRALETHAVSPKTEPVKIDGKLTVEHLMPEKWEKHWPLPAGVNPDEAEAERKRLVQTVGNLTLLTKSLNPSISNGPWSKKREAIQENSVLKLNNRLWDQSIWDEQAIRRRGEELFRLALEIWPRPA